MKKLKPLDYTILYELIKNARISDRKLAKILGVSQATVSRKRAFLERELIDGYTAIPNWGKFGYEIFALTLVRYKSALHSKEKYDVFRKRGTEWLMKQPIIIMASGCQGTGINSFIISIHKDYSDFDMFMHELRLEWGQFVDDIQTLLVNLAGTQVLKPLNLKYLAESK